MTPAETVSRLRRLANDWREEEKRLCEQLGNEIIPRSMRARRIKDTKAIDAAVEMIERSERLEVALRDVAQTLAWRQHGKRGGFSEGAILTTNEALGAARAALEESK